MIIKILITVLLISMVALNLFYYSANIEPSGRYTIVLIVVIVLILTYFISMAQLGDYICAPLNSVVTGI